MVSKFVITLLLLFCVCENQNFIRASIVLKPSMVSSKAHSMQSSIQRNLPTQINIFTASVISPNSSIPSTNASVTFERDTEGVIKPSIKTIFQERVTLLPLLRRTNFTINCSLSYREQTILKDYDMKAFNESYSKQCLSTEEPAWWDDPRIYFIGGGCIGGLILLAVLKVICGYCSKYCDTYYPPHYKAPRRKRGKNGWTLRHIDKMPVITDVSAPRMHGPSSFI